MEGIGRVGLFSEQDDLARELYGVDANAANTVGMNSPQNIIDAALATSKSSAGVKSLVVVSEYMKVKRAIYEAMSKSLANCSKVGREMLQRHKSVYEPWCSKATGGEEIHENIVDAVDNPHLH